MPIRIITILAAILILISGAGVTHADHQGPNRVVDGKYLVVLSVVSNSNNSLEMRFFFNDAKTGKRVSDITATVSISSANGGSILDKEPIEVIDGVAVLKYTFPSSGLFDVSLEFKKNGENQVYVPEKWSVNVGDDPPIGLSDFASLGVAGVAIILISLSFLLNRKK